MTGTHIYGSLSIDMTPALVAAQFLLIILLLLSASAQLLSTPVALALILAGVLLGGWTIAYNRIGNFNIRPEPRENTILVTTGPYRFVRHPMYVAVLLVMAPFALFSQNLIGLLCWLLLLVVLWKKASLEEEMLLRRFEEYGRYKKATGRFLPRFGSRMKV